MKIRIHFSLHQAILIVAIVNLAGFMIENAVAFFIGSVALLADSIDFLEDASVNFLILPALAWTAKARARLGMGLAAFMLTPALAILWMAWGKINTFTPPDPILLALTGGGALLINLSCALIMNPFRKESGSLTQAAFYFSRNDALANIFIILSAVITFFWPVPWPDLAVGLVIAALNAGAARSVWQEARREFPAPSSPAA